MSTTEEKLTPAKDSKPRPERASFSAADGARIRAFLDKLCASAEFARSEQMTRFLRFLVDHTLAGNSNLNERAIALAVFGKEPGWDPRDDTIVRTEARRLRGKLDTYYQGIGRFDPIRFSVPKGGYLASIEIVELAEPIPAGFDVVQGEPLLVATSQPRRTARIAFAASAIVVVCCGFFYIRSRMVEAKAGPGIAFTITPVANEIGQEYSPAVSPDGKRIAYVWDGDHTNLDIYIKTLASGEVRRFTTDSAPDLYPAWSPDGQSLAFLRKGDSSTEVLLKSIDGKTEKKITDIGTEGGRWAGDNSPLLGNPGPAWTPDGRWLIVTDIQSHAGSTGLYAVELQTGQRKQLTASVGEVRDFYPRISPDGKMLAYVRYFTHGFAQLFVADIDPASKQMVSAPRQLTTEKQAIRGLTWSALGVSLLFASNQLGQFQLWQKSISGTGGATLVPTETSPVADPSTSRGLDGIVFVKTTENWNIWRSSLGAGNLGTPTRLLASSGENHSPMYSPDGQSIAFVSDRSGSAEIWVSSQDGLNLRRLTNLKGAWIASPVWSPDGRYIAFDARPEGRASIYIVPTTGGEAKPLSLNSFEERGPVWSRDGKSLYFNSNRGGSVALWKAAFPYQTPIQVGPSGSYLAQESLDGKKLFYDDLQGNFFTSDLDGSHPVPLPGKVRVNPVAAWTLGPKGLYFLKQRLDNRSDLNLYEAGRVSILGSTQQPIVYNTKDISISPDGKSLLFGQQDSVGSDILLRRITESH